MKERTEGRTDLTGLRFLIFFCAITVVAPIAILLLCSLLVSLDQYPLPSIYLAVYVLAGIASPIMGVFGLVGLLVRRRTFRGTLSRVERRLRACLLILSIINIFAILIWFMFFPYLLFSIGGTR